MAAAARPHFPPPSALVEGDLRATLRNLAQIEIRDAIASGGLVLRLALEARSVPEVREAMGTISSSNLERMASMALAIAAMLIVEWLVTDELLLPPLVVFATVALVSVGVADRAIRSIDGRARRRVSTDVVPTEAVASRS